MMEINISSVSDIIDTITRIENSIFSRSQDIDGTKYHFYPAKNKMKQYCSYHKSSKHDSSECREMRSKNNSLQNNRDNKRILSMSKNKSEKELIILPAKINDTKLNVLIDSGSTENVINRKYASILKTEKIEAKFLLKLADGRNIEAKERFKFILNFDQIPSTSYFCQAYIIEDLSFDMILGTRFLNENKAVLDFELGFLQLDGIQVDYCNYYNPDNHLLTIKKDYVKMFDEIKVKFDHSEDKLFEIKDSFFEIITTKNEPIIKKQYPVPIKYKEKTREHINDLLKNGIVRRSNSDYSSPAFVIYKPDRSLRLLIDYRKLNDITTSKKFPFPKISEIFIDLDNPKVFSKIDLKMGFYLLPIREDSIHKTVFVILDQKFEFLRMPFGVKNAPFFFQSIIMKILSDLNFVKVYIDDILIFSKDHETHYRHLSEIFKRFSKNNVCVNFNKSEFFKEEVSFLGHLVGNKGIKPYIQKYKKIFKNTDCKGVKNLQKIIGLIQWFRPYIENLSQKILPLTNKLIKNVKFVWNENDKKILKAIYNDIERQPCLKYPDLNLDFTLHCDSSEESIGSVLCQNNNIIGYYSMKFNETEKRYTITEKEFYCIYLSLRHFREIVLGAKIQIFTDNKNLISNKDMSISNRILKWKSMINEFDYLITHIKGEENNAADHISRNFINVLECKNDNTILKYLNEIGLNFSNKNKKIIKDSEFENVIRKLHSKLGHPGIKKMYQFSKELFLNKHLYLNIEKITKKCNECQTNKHFTNNKHKIKHHLLQSKIKEIISSDISGPYNLQKEYTDKKFYIITFTDLFSRFTNIDIIKDINSLTISHSFVNNWISKFGAPNHILTDQGRQYTSKIFSSILNKYSIEQIFSSTNNPQGNGISERINKSINEIIRIFQDKSKNEIKNLIFNRLNLLKHSSTGFQPYVIFLNNIQ
ncbi:Transposon Tf2-9 polyprotein [Dictyocoela muelleri]|nr:Transposon Tf2-9 polyprotein [Dictyocoela muelleri]